MKKCAVGSGNPPMVSKSLSAPVPAIISQVVKTKKTELLFLALFLRLLKPGGLLVLGPGEVLGFTHPLLTRLGGPQTLAFRRNG